ncbi:MAG: aconitate hydratase [Clostridia bacterium]|nr:aconitate hydratase [Clostridia bacterium]
MTARQTLTEKLLSAHLISGEMTAGALCRFRVDSVLFHDMSGILALMAYDAMEQKRAGVALPLVFTDHNLVGMDAQTAGDQAFVKSCARAFGLKYSRPGNGVCHSLVAEDYARPGLLLIGADSHTATCGALGMLGIGLGGMEAATAMTGKPFPLRVPKVIGVHLAGRLKPGVSAMDIALTLLAKMTIKGAVNAVLEYTGEGTAALTVPQRLTLANLGAEMGATSSLFPSDAQVDAWLKAQGRPEAYTPLAADEGAAYAQTVPLNLSEVEPMVALPGRPDRGVPIRAAEPVSFSQVFIGSCANGSYESLVRAAQVLKGRHVADNTELLVACGSRRVYRQLLRDGYVDIFLDAGARLLESGCGPCMGIGQAPTPGAHVLRTTNRNFPGRSGTRDAEIYLASPETAAASAVTGRLTAVSELLDPAEMDALPPLPEKSGFDGLYLPYDQTWTGEDRPVYTASIRPIPTGEPLPDALRLPVSLKAGDGISTDDIVPGVPQALALRANIPELAKYLFHYLDEGFAGRAAGLGTSMIVAGEDYAQGSSREHAAAGCLALGVRAVLVKSIHRIHRANLINYGILPLLFDRAEDDSLIQQGDVLSLTGIHEGMRSGHLLIHNDTNGAEISCHTDLNSHEAQLLRMGGLLRSARRESK